jgi:glucosamine--fructose-6-phosphate aminotransferase (isomerizing)
MTGTVVDGGGASGLGVRTQAEIESQPEVWQRALADVAAASLLARPGERVLLLGCGTSAFVAESIAVLREAAGLGLTDAAYASEPFAWRDYDTVIALTRSGTTTEVLDALAALPPGTHRVVVTGVADSPVVDLADEVLLLDYADETSVVQTRFPTTTLLLARAAFGEDVSGLPDACAQAMAQPLAVDTTDFDHFVFLGRGWTRGLAQEAALKIRESAQAWAETYPLLDYRHGPLAVAGPRSLVWVVGGSDATLEADVRRVGATVVAGTHDPLVELVVLQRLALAVARDRGLDPDAPRHLTRSIVLG